MTTPLIDRDAASTNDRPGGLDESMLSGSGGAPANTELSQIQLETVSPAGARALIYGWYLVLIVAFSLQMDSSLQWQCSNICGDERGRCRLTDVTSWSSRDCAVLRSAANVSNATWTLPPSPFVPAGNATAAPPRPTAIVDHRSVIQWEGGFSHVFNTHLNRFVHLMMAVARPANRTDDGVISFPVHFAVQLRNATRAADDYTQFTFEMTVWCLPGHPMCNPVTLPTTTSSINNVSSVILTATNVADAYRDAVLGSSIGAVYQRPDYTISTLVIRYTLLLVAVLHLARFLYNNSVAAHQASVVQTGSGRYEKVWVLALQAGLIGYLNPLFAVGVFDTPEGSFFSFLEFRVAFYFVVIMAAFMFALVSSATSWTAKHSHSSPVYVKVANVLFVAVVVVLDIIDAWEHDWDWAMEHCPNFSCSPYGYAIYSLIAAFILVSIVWLRVVRNNLGKKPYLSTRPQQLAMRLFIFIFSTYAIYYVLSTVVVLLIYEGYSDVVTYHALLQIGPIIVAFAFVTIMTFAYTDVVRTEDVPPHPINVRWKRLLWPDKWFEWVSQHGGTCYMFFSEEEERVFWAVQDGEVAALATAESIYDPATEAEVDAQHAAGGCDQSELFTPDDAEYASTGYHGRSYSTRSKSVFQTALDAPAHLIDRVHDGLTSAAVALHFISRPDRKPFFNLEACIDCFNLAWEAYGASACLGDEAVNTGIDMTWRGIAARVCCCCQPKKEAYIDTLAVDYGDSPRASRASHNHPDDESSNGFATPLMSPTEYRDRKQALAESGTEPNGAAAAPLINTEQYGYSTVAVFTGADVQVVISTMDTSVARHRDKGERIVVAFRGTDNMSNAVQDLSYAKTEFREMASTTLFETATAAIIGPRVHGGFNEVWGTLRERVMGSVQQLWIAEPSSQVTVTGHSLGGAVAVMCAYAISKRGLEEGFEHPSPTVYTFGMPRTGNDAFAQEYMKKLPNTFRVVNESDAVSRLSIVGGTHVGVEVCIDRHGNLIIDPMFIESFFRPTKGKGSALSHHSMSGYGASIDAIAARTGLGVCPSTCNVAYVEAAYVDEGKPVVDVTAVDRAAAADDDGGRDATDRTRLVIAAGDI
jgi:hypothetical protein